MERKRWPFWAVYAAFVLCVLGVTVEARQFGPRAETTPAGMTGWWVRVNPANQATHTFWRFGPAGDRLGTPITWAQGTSPAALDAPADQRMLERVHIAALGMPPAAPVSFCVFFADRGVALLEFTQEINLDVDRNQSAEQCMP